MCQESKASIHILPLLDSLGEGRVLLYHGVVDHEVLHGGLVYEEIRRTSPSADLTELVTWASVSTEGNLVASFGPESHTEGVGTVNGSTDVKFLEPSDVKESVEVCRIELLELLLRILLQCVIVSFVVENESLTLDMVTLSKDRLELGMVVG